MKNKNKKTQIDIPNIILRFFFGFLIPFIIINSIIFFLYTDAPVIKIKEYDDNNYNLNEIEFSINSYLPIVEVVVTSQDENIEYRKNGEKYVIPVSSNGTYKISAKSINNMVAVYYKTVSTIDDTPPLINSETIVFTNGTLTFNITDNQSGVNYNKIYAVMSDGSNLEPIYVDKSTGTVQFKLENANNISIHIEDQSGNYSDTSVSY